MTILLAGGGSGGHILPNIALYQELKKQYPDQDIVYMGEIDGMEEHMARDAGMTFYGIHAGKMRRYFSLQNCVDWFKIPVGCIEALWHIMRIKPSVTFSKGGYVSVPVAVASFFARVPLVIHESDVRPGLATRICSAFATTVCVSWEETKKYLKSSINTVLTGVPVRASLMQGSAVLGRESLEITDDAPLMMVTGGSLGASDINDFIVSVLPNLLSKWHVFHLTGKGKNQKNAIDFTQFPKTYTAQEFGDEHFENRFAAADIIISRAGTTYLAEFAALGKNVILIPLPADRSRGDQIDNAKAFKAMYPQKTYVIPQEELSLETLETALHFFAAQESQKQALPSEAARLVINEILKASKRTQGL